MVERGCPTRRRIWVPGVDLSITVVGSLIAGGTVLSSFSTRAGDDGDVQYPLRRCRTGVHGSAHGVALETFLDLEAPSDPRGSR